MKYQLTGIINEEFQVKVTIMKSVSISTLKSMKAAISAFGIYEHLTIEKIV